MWSNLSGCLKSGAVIAPRKEMSFSKLNQLLITPDTSTSFVKAGVVERNIESVLADTQGDIGIRKESIVPYCCGW